MYEASNINETRPRAIVTDPFGLSDRRHFEELSDPAELESWTMEEIKDFLPSHGSSVMAEFEVPWRQNESFTQIYGLAD